MAWSASAVALATPNTTMTSWMGSRSISSRVTCDSPLRPGYGCRVRRRSAETINGLYKAKVIHRQSWKNAAALEELEAARLAFRALVEASLPKPLAEKSPHHAHDYEDAPEWATHILEGFPSDGI